MRLASVAAIIAFAVAALIVFLMEGPRPDDLTVAVPTDDPATGGPVLEPPAGASPTASIRPETRALTVDVVHDATGSGIAEADVAVLTEALKESTRTTTSPTGRARLEVEHGAWVRVRHPKFHEKRVELPKQLDEHSVVRVELVGRGTLSVSVLDASDGGAPLEHAKVEVDPVGMGPAAAIGPLSTDPKGAAAFPSVPLGTIAVVRVTKPGFTSSARRVNVSVDGSVTVELQPVESLQLSIELAGYESTALLFQRVTLFHRDEDGTLGYVKNLDLMFRNGAARATLAWSHGAVPLVGQLRCELDHSHVWEAETAVQSSGILRTHSLKRRGQEETIQTLENWKATLRFDDLGAGLRLRFLAQTEDSTAPAARMSVQFAREGSKRLGTLATDAEGRVGIPLPADVQGSFRFWVQKPGLVSPVMNLRADGTESEVVLANNGGDLLVRGWRGSGDRLKVEERVYGAWSTGIFARRAESELIAHLPPGRYRLSSNRTPLGGFDYVVTAGQTTVADMSGDSDGAIHGRVPGPDEEVELLRSASHVDRPIRFEKTRSTATGEFMFLGLPAGTYVVRRSDAQGRPSWLPVELETGEVKDVGLLGEFQGQDVEITLLYESGSPVTDGVVLWESPKSTGFKLRLSPDAKGVIRSRLPGRGDIALFGPGCGAVLPAGTSPLTLRIPSPDADERMLKIDMISPTQREAIVVCEGRLGAVAIVRRLESGGVLKVSRRTLETARFVWDEGWGFYRVQSGRADRPKRVLVPVEWIPEGTHSCRVVLHRAGDMNLHPLGWHRSYALPKTASTSGLQLHVASGWELRLDFLGGEQRSLLLSAHGDAATIKEIR